MSITYITDLLEKNCALFKIFVILNAIALMKVYVKSIKCWILFGVIQEKLL